MISLTNRILGFWLYILRAASLISDVAMFQALVMFHTFGCLLGSVPVRCYGTTKLLY